VFANTKSYCWNHAFSDIFGGLLDNGLRIDFLHEHEAVPWQIYPSAVQGEDWMFRLPDASPRIPLAFSLRASKPR
jgi:hypothetical protein